MAKERGKINLACMFLPLCVKYRLYNRTLSCKFGEDYFSLRVRENKCVKQLCCVAEGKTDSDFRKYCFSSKMPLKWGKKTTYPWEVFPQNFRKGNGTGIINFSFFIWRIPLSFQEHLPICIISKELMSWFLNRHPPKVKGKNMLEIILRQSSWHHNCHSTGCQVYFAHGKAIVRIKG